MKIGVVADTHSKELPKQMLVDLKSVDLIIHAGDFCEARDYEALAKIKEVKAVYGNMDNSEIRKLFPRKRLFLGLFPSGLSMGKGRPRRSWKK